MSVNRPNYSVIAALTVAISGGFSVASVAEELSVSDIVRALAPPVTRSLATNQKPDPAQAADEAFIDSVRTHGDALSDPEIAKLDEMVAKRQQISFEMAFGYKDSALRGKALKTAKMLGEALQNGRLKDQKFLIMGHTDAKGSNAANQKLSERRAAAVVDFLVSTYKIPAERLVAVGYGETHLKNPNTPFAGENRRVQVVNIMAVKDAGN